MAYINGRIINEGSFASNATTSSMTMGVLAVIMVRWLEIRVFIYICILSTSLSMIRRVECEDSFIWRQSFEDRVTAAILNKQDTIIFVLVHPGVVVNERRAGNAAISDGQPLDRSNVISALREQASNENLQPHPFSSIDTIYKLSLTTGAPRDYDT